MRTISSLFLCLISLTLTAQKKIDKKLQKQVAALVKDFNGGIGVYIKNLKNNKVVAINADSIFPTASIVKVPILVGIMHKIETGAFTYHQPLTYADSLFYSSGDITGNLKNNTKIELGKLIMLMLTTSDNTASLWLQSLAGTGTTINEMMDSLGLHSTRVNSRTTGRSENWKQYGWGQTTPYEMASLMEKIYNKDVINTAASEKMLRLLGRNFWDEQAISQIPANIFVASKNGAVDESRDEILLVMGKTPYLFSVFTKNNKDQRWSNDNEAWVLTRKLSKLVWEHFNGKN